MNKPDLSVQLGPLKFRNPVLLASGTVGYGNEMSEFIELNSMGASRVNTRPMYCEPRRLRVGSPEMTGCA